MFVSADINTKSYNPHTKAPLDFGRGGFKKETGADLS